MELQLEQIRKSFGEKEVLKGCTFRFEKGKIYGLLGRNGAGKTTLFNCLSDEIAPTAARQISAGMTGHGKHWRKITLDMYFPHRFCRIFSRDTNF